MPSDATRSFDTSLQNRLVVPFLLVAYLLAAVSR